MKNLILAHDLGTSGDKACIFDTDGSFVGSAYETYPTYYEEAGCAEQDPEDWWKAVRQSTLKVIKNYRIDPKDIKAMSFSAQSLGCVPVDSQGRPTRKRTMIWMDGRAIREANYILERYGERRHYETTGNSFAVSLYPCSKIMWIKKHEPEVDARTYKYIGTKEYIIHKLTGVLGITDYSEAGMSGMFNLKTHDYEREILDIAGIDREKLCNPTDNTHVVGSVLPGLEKETGLTPETKVILGTLDNLACATGAGCMNQGTFVACLGTAAWLGVNSESPLMSPEFKSNVMYVGGGVYHTSVHSHSACAAYDWVAEHMLPHLKGKFEEMEELARRAPAGADRLLFMPSFQGGNTVYGADYMGGAFLGLRLHHTEGNLIRAVLEGISLDLMMGAEFFESLGISPQKARIIGGGSKNGLWREILSSMLGASMETPEHMQHIGALGAAVIAGVGAGMFEGFDVTDRLLKMADETKPDGEIKKAYLRILPTYKKMYEALMPLYGELYREG